MNRTLAATALLLLAGCGEQKQVPSTMNDASAATSAAATKKEVPSLAGQWVVATIDGRPVGEGSAMTASFEGAKAVIAAGCLRRAWSYSQKQNVIAFQSAPEGSANCGRSPSGEQESAYVALENSNMAIFGKDGRTASLSGTGGNLGLERR